MPEPSAREAELMRLLEQSQEQLQAANAKIALLEAKIDLLIRKVFGAKSERLDPAQLLLLLQGGDEPPKAPEPVAAEAPRRSTDQSPPRERQPRMPEHLPLEVRIIEPEAVRIAPEQWRKIGEEVSERLDYEPARFIRLRTVRPKYVHKTEIDAVPIVAPLPDSLLERSKVGPGLMAQILTGKYCDHLPLYRQQTIYWRQHQVWLPRQTLAEWVALGADWLRPIYEQIRSEVFGRGYTQIDESPIRHLAPGNGRTKLGYLWVCNDPRGEVCFHWETSRAATCLERIVPINFEGKLQCDAYEAYDCFVRRRGSGIELVGCLAHVRRKFYDAAERTPSMAGWILRQIQLLYEIEQKLRTARAGPRKRQAERTSASRMIMARLHRALVRLKLKRHFLPQSLMGKAIHYALAQWSSLLVFLEDGRIEIDNNLVENAIRPTAVGKKNWLFIGDADAGDRSAIIYTLIESCRRHRIDPFAYLRDIFTRLPSATNWQVKALTPAAWAKAQQQPSQVAA